MARLALLCLAGLAALSPAPCPASAGPVPWGNWPRWGDQGDGTYLNPVLPADYSDLDCIRVGSDFYAISSTFQFSPGVVILHSKDLVNWQVAGHAVNDLTQISPELNWDRMNRYGRGIWAGAIRHHAGRFWIYFGTPDEGLFMTSAPAASGPWEPLHRVLPEPGWDDCCPFWDDDGTGWFVATHFSDGYKTWLFPLTPDGRDLVRGEARLINEGLRREANKLYKINGTYYHLFSEFRPEIGRYVMMQRAPSITGPYQAVRQLSHAQRQAMEPNQGGLVQTEKGDWQFLTHHGTGQWEGRAASLLPVTWIEGWPILGAPGADGIGTMVWSARKPIPGSVATPQTKDDFSGPTLGLQWEWNYQPRGEKWSLSERPGFLRLHGFRALEGDNLFKVGNVLTQRAMRAADSVATARFDLGGLADGAHAGLCHFSAARRKNAPAANSASLGAVQEAGRRFLEYSRDGLFIRGPALPGNELWIRSSWSLDGSAQFAYSTDGKVFAPFGEPYPLSWGSYRGDRIGLFVFNNRAEAGYLDVDDFEYAFSGPGAPASPPRSSERATVSP